MVVGTGRAAPTRAAAPARTIRWLTDAAARDRSLVGAKAANLARAGWEGLPIVEGFAIPVPQVAAHTFGLPPGVERAWARLSVQGEVPLVVRSSAPDEDGGATSMAGLYESVVGVITWPAFVEAYSRVVASARGGDMAVLVQRHLDPTISGVLFGVDPVSGRTDRAVIAAVAGGPQLLVSGEVQGRRIEVDRTGRVRAADGDHEPVLTTRQRRQLLALARRAHAVFGGPQDIEWAIDGRQLVLLQSRPVTATAGRAAGPLLGPGPVAETFPRPLAQLEQDLWVPPLRDATREVLSLTGAASRRQLRRSPVVQVVDGQVVADLRLFGAAPTRHRVRALFDPRPHVRHLAVAWRVGRLRGALGALSQQLIAEVDQELRSLPPLSDADDEQLVHLLENCRTYLRSLHGHEMLAGTLLDDDGPSGAEVALHAIAAGQALGWSDEDILARRPVALAVTPPTLGPRPELPGIGPSGPAPTGTMPVREQLRVRVRWVHELSRLVVREAGRRLHERGDLVDPERLAHVTLDELVAGLRGAVVRHRDAPDAPLPVPAYFRLTPDGLVVSEQPAGTGAGVGAGGGRGSGPVAFDTPVPGDVLVVRTLDPDLAPLLPHLAGIVAETGSPLSHLAILARERGVPVVVGHTTIRTLVEPGTVVTVDGRSGAVEVVDPSDGSDR